MKIAHLILLDYFEKTVAVENGTLFDVSISRFIFHAGPYIHRSLRECTDTRAWFLSGFSEAREEACR